MAGASPTLDHQLLHEAQQGAAPPATDQEPALTSGKLVNHGLLTQHLARTG